MSAPLPPGWREITAENGKKYYYNSSTKQTTWQRPNGSDVPGAVSEKRSRKQSVLADQGNPSADQSKSESHSTKPTSRVPPPAPPTPSAAPKAPPPGTQSSQSAAEESNAFTQSNPMQNRPPPPKLGASDSANSSKPQAPAPPSAPSASPAPPAPPAPPGAVKPPPPQLNANPVESPVAVAPPLKSPAPPAPPSQNTPPAAPPAAPAAPAVRPAAPSAPTPPPAPNAPATSSNVQPAAPAAPPAPVIAPIAPPPSKAALANVDSNNASEASRVVSSPTPKSNPLPEMGNDESTNRDSLSSNSARSVSEKRPAPPTRSPQSRPPPPSRKAAGPPKKENELDAIEMSVAGSPSRPGTARKSVIMRGKNQGDDMNGDENSNDKSNNSDHMDQNSVKDNESVANSQMDGNDDDSEDDGDDNSSTAKREKKRKLLDHGNFSNSHFDDSFMHEFEDDESNTFDMESQRLMTKHDFPNLKGLTRTTKSHMEVPGEVLNRVLFKDELIAAEFDAFYSKPVLPTATVILLTILTFGMFFIYHYVIKVCINYIRNNLCCVNCKTPMSMQRAKIIVTNLGRVICWVEKAHQSFTWDSKVVFDITHETMVFHVDDIRELNFVYVDAPPIRDIRGTPFANKASATTMNGISSLTGIDFSLFWTLLSFVSCIFTCFLKVCGRCACCRNYSAGVDICFHAFQTSSAHESKYLKTTDNSQFKSTLKSLISDVAQMTFSSTQLQKLSSLLEPKSKAFRIVSDRSNLCYDGEFGVETIEDVCKLFDSVSRVMQKHTRVKKDVFLDSRFSESHDLLNAGFDSQARGVKEVIEDYNDFTIVDSDGLVTVSLRYLPLGPGEKLVAACGQVFHWRARDIFLTIITFGIYYFVSVLPRRHHRSALVLTTQRLVEIQIVEPRGHVPSSYLKFQFFVRHLFPSKVTGGYMLGDGFRVTSGIQTEGGQIIVNVGYRQIEFAKKMQLSAVRKQTRLVEDFEPDTSGNPSTETSKMSEEELNQVGYRMRYKLHQLLSRGCENKAIIQEPDSYSLRTRRQSNYEGQFSHRSQNTKAEYRKYGFSLFPDEEYFLPMMNSEIFLHRIRGGQVFAPCCQQGDPSLGTGNVNYLCHFSSATWCTHIRLALVHMISCCFRPLVTSPHLLITDHSVFYISTKRSNPWCESTMPIPVEKYSFSVNWFPIDQLCDHHLSIKSQGWHFVDGCDLFQCRQCSCNYPNHELDKDDGDPELRAGCINAGSCGHSAETNLSLTMHGGYTLNLSKKKRFVNFLKDSEMLVSQGLLSVIEALVKGEITWTSTKAKYSLDDTDASSAV